MERAMSDMHTNGCHITKPNREQELKIFDNTKAVVKGLVDGGIGSVPEMFIETPDGISESSSPENATLHFPVIDLTGVDYDNNSRKQIVEQIRDASEKWGFFQVVNHGIPLHVLGNTLEKAKMFHEQDVEYKKEYYSREIMKQQVVYSTNFDLHKSKAANWRDTLTVNHSITGNLDPNLLPPLCRDAIMDHTSHVLQLGNVLLELLSLALGLRPDRLKELDCEKGWACVYHYQPACPQPELTLGRSRHTDSSFFTVLLQDHIGGLQVLHHNHWVDVQPIHGSLVINIGDLLQMITNDKFISVCHRVKANRVGPRLSSAFFFTGMTLSPKIYAPIQELLSKDNPPIYRGFTIHEFLTHFFSRPVSEARLKHCMIENSNAIS